LAPCPNLLEPTGIGNPVNVAARVEAPARDTGDTLLRAERTRGRLRAEHPALVARHGVALDGKSDGVRVYAPARE
jgi:class 3 adenylate cyclase